MSWHMVHCSEIESLRTPLQFLTFSEAYLDSAARLCAIRAASPNESSYPRGAVILSLAFHGIELFLKAAILEKAPEERFGGRAGHDIEYLYKRYKNLFPGAEYVIEVPFRKRGIDSSGLNLPITEELRDSVNAHERATPTDQLHRYPRNMEGQPWQGIYAFEPNSFSLTISQVQEDISRLRESIFLGPHG
ncbi:hypothetical protein [Sulfuritalea sp.]|uniref:hypothetical protein n=1 Tax=Sulfuritalea sp. TaxID=2480090 RepID=UPI001AC64B44|nr:hypothetical protein [Sulfuritalea sp.]MBN8476123.1 hypothetical protein [Sulfuritalea sp.]